MLKKMLCLAAALLLTLVCVPALAGGNGMDALTLEELTTWAEGYLQMASETEPLNDPHDAEALTEIGYAYVYEFGTLYFDKPEAEGAELTGLVVLDRGFPGPRGTQVGMTSAELMNAFRNENDSLVGNFDAAMLYMDGTLDNGAAAGMVQRDGQRIQGVQYSVYEKAADGSCTSAGVLYTLQDDLVSAIRMWGLTGSTSEEDVRAELREMESVFYAMSYAQVPTSINGSELAMFSAEDLVLNGMDMATITPEIADAYLGPIMQDAWLDNDGEGSIRAIDFTDCSMLFLYDDNRQHCQLMMLDITIDGMEGPRGVRVGDTLSSVLCRFRNGEGGFEGMTEMLYGNTEAGPCGVAEYGSDGSAILRYSVPLSDGRTAALIVNFDQIYANEVLLHFGK